MRRLTLPLRARGQRCGAPLRRLLLALPLAFSTAAAASSEDWAAGMIESSAAAPQAVVGLPTLRSGSGKPLELQPNVRLNYELTPAPAAAPPPRAMFLARPAAADAGPEEWDALQAAPRGAIPDADAQDPADHPADPGAVFFGASQRRAADEAALDGELPPPRPSLDEPWSLEDQVVSEELFLHRLRQQAVQEDWELLDESGLQGEAWGSGAEFSGAGQSILSGPALGGTLSGPQPPRGHWLPRPGRWARRGLDRIRATRQRVDAGLGSLLVAHAPLMLDTTQPRNQLRLRSDFGYGIAYPDRSEYFWASPLRGPGYVGDIDYQEFAFMFEIGGEAFSLQTELPVRSYDPQFGGGHTALGDIRITQKLRLVNGDDVQVTQMLRIHTPSGNTKLGAGTGHVSLEPGALFRYRYSDWTYLHAELKYLFPISGDPLYSGDVLSYGLGLTSVWYETLTTAVMPTLELTSINFLTGRKTDFLGPLPVDGESSFALHPGIRFAWDPGGDLGTTELGIGPAIAFSRDRFYDSMLRFELRLCR